MRDSLYGNPPISGLLQNKAGREEPELTVEEGGNERETTLLGVENPVRKARPRESKRKEQVSENGERICSV